ncbi:MAG TPA: hypothetical protein VNU01_11965 [Egibacteraceae bacterium]|nr:hypothetical protein [Egibacteraceae bacterium]
MHRHGEHGGVIVSGLLRTAVWVGLFCVLAFDTGGIVTNRVLLDEATRVAARQAADSLDRSRGVATASAVRAAREAAEDSVADQPGIEVLDVAVERGEVSVTARRRARVLVADRIPPLRDHVEAESRASASLGGP